jgi:hypothetical protein
MMPFTEISKHCREICYKIMEAIKRDKLKREIRGFLLQFDLERN